MPKIDTDTEEGKAELQRIIDAETKGLKDKNAELLASQKKLKDDMKSFQDQLDEITAEKEKALEDATAKKGNVEEVRKQLEEKHAKEVKKLTDQLDGLKSQREKLLIDGGLADALDKAGVAPQMKEVVKAFLKQNNKFEINETDGNPFAQVGGKALGDFVAEWAKDDTAKPFIAAEDNSGGDTKAKGRTDPAKGGAKKKSEMSHVERAEFITEKGQDAYNALPA